MTKSIITIILTLLAASTLAIPINSRSINKRSFKVPRVEVKNYVPNGPKALKRAYAKFGISEPLSGPSSLHKRELKFGFGDLTIVPTGDVAKKISSAVAGSTSGTENGETTATGTQNDAQFLSPVTIGGQELIVNFDSGSADTWVFNTGLPARSQQGHTVFDPSKSSTFKLLEGETFNISYGDGSTASGPVGTDSFDVGGSTVDVQAIGVPNIVSQSFVTDSASNGLVGLAFSKLNTVSPTAQKTFFDNVIAELSQPVFTAQLRGDAAGSYEFGHIDTSSFTGELNVIPIDSSRGFWEFDSTSAIVNNKAVQIQGGKAIADTGTSLMLVTDDLLTAYWNEVEGATLNQQVGGVIFPCNAQLPDLQVAIGNKMATVAGANFNFAAIGTDTTSGEDFCFGGMQSSGGIPFSIYGDVFFKSNFVVFEATTPSLGFAPHS
ncbi:hypothetical protein LTR64_003235 [Lithohypha guttulata]|uniref:Peptidase A1 domain-containing protein n=1 Tax=Lithohypha guttulata TaxID=1690604 RepID=A0AAN7SZV7_9EURO|nr:hypothetical protein LTR51_000543 [Lithohypha guttulata]KAK5085731.1 hypothetical protein LTR05_005019 [Lithohypha guttulata]